MQRALVLLLVLASGCASTPQDTPARFADKLAIEPEWTGFVEVVLDPGRSAAWTWDSDALVATRWSLRCLDSQDNASGGGVNGASGSDEVVSSGLGCKLVVFWGPAAKPTMVEVHLETDGIGYRAGTEDGQGY